MSAYAMQPLGSAKVKVSHAYDHGANGYDRGPKASRTGVRRLFSFTQMFFFALSYMNSWEGISTCASKKC
ncbi:hypothetical protein LTR37_009373 [Vermiconidia calcicola]|uniref:Uncharacterized protein n=1 Tax=Vermiconidia calcicola TaxID=1690605 RepID=A0ACC3N957_9PEZI|nr:hypothetical protein LTR37_009373 [Vermiconidia calcicola]